MKNQEDIGKAVAAFYGEAAGQQLTKLLDHILKMSDAIAEGIVKQFPEKFGAKPTTTSGVR